MIEVIESRREELTEVNFEAAIEGLGNCQEATNPSLLNTLVEDRLNKVKKEAKSFSQSHILNLLTILPTMTHPGVVKHEKLIEELIIELYRRMAHGEADPIRMHEVLFLSSAFRSFKLSNHKSKAVASQYSSIIYKSLLQCLSVEVSNPASFGMKLLAAVNQNIDQSTVDAMTVAVYCSALKVDIAKLNNCDKLRLACLMLRRGLVLEKDSLTSEQKEALGPLAYLPDRLQMDVRKKDYWNTMQVYLNEYLPLRDLGKEKGLQKVPAQVISIGEGLEKEIEELFSDIQKVYQHQVNATMLISELIICPRSSEKWVQLFIRSLSSMDDIQLKSTLKQFFNFITILHHRFAINIGRKGVQSVFQVVTSCKEKILRDSSLVAKCFEFMCNLSDSDLTIQNGEPVPEVAAFIEETSTFDNDSLERLSRVMTFNDIKRLVYRSDMLDVDNKPMLKSLVGFKVASQLNAEISMAAVLSSFELLYYFDEDLCISFLKYPEITNKIGIIENQLKAGKMRSANTLVKVFHMLVCLDRVSLEKAKYDETLDQSNRLDNLIKKKKLTTQDLGIHKERVRDILSNCKALALKSVEGTAEGSNTKNIVLTFNLVSVLLEYHFRIEQLDEKDQLAIVEKVKVNYF